MKKIVTVLALVAVLVNLGGFLSPHISEIEEPQALAQLATITCQIVILPGWDANYTEFAIISFECSF